MDFYLSNEEKMLQKMYREFAENEVRPLAEEIDEGTSEVQRMVISRAMGVK